MALAEYSAGNRPSKPPWSGLKTKRQQPLDSFFSFLSLQGLADSKVERHEIIPAVLLGIVQLVLLAHPADARALAIDTTALAGRIVVTAGAIAPIEELGLVRQMDVLATQAALRAGEWRGGHGSVGHDTR